jgi:hypothetical protein
MYSQRSTLNQERNRNMGNRACVIFYDSRRISSTVYLHWHGESVPAWLEQLKHLMNRRFDDAAYAAARFVGISHQRIECNMSLGVLSNGLTLAEIHDESRMQAESPGNAGIVAVDTRDFTWKAYGGYLAENGRD